MCSTNERMLQRGCLALILAAQVIVSLVLFRHLGDQLNADGVAYGRAAQLWLQGNAALALNAEWGVLCSWLAVPGLALRLDPSDALRSGQIVAALVLTAGTYALLGSFHLRPLTRLVLVLAAALHAASASTAVLASDASFVAVFVWMSVALLTERERFLGLPRPLIAGALGGLSFLARPIGLPMGIAMVAASEIMRAFGDRFYLRARSALVLAASGWASVALPWILVLSVHYGELTLTHSAGVVHTAVGPHTGHPFNVPNFTHLHFPPAGRVTTWEDPGAFTDPSLEWSAFESQAAWEHQTRLIRHNLAEMVKAFVGMDGDGLALVSLFVVPVLALARPRRGVGWCEPWLLLPLALHVAALAPLYVEGRYLWPLLPMSLAGLGSLADRIAGQLAPPGATNRPMRILAAVVTLLVILPPAVLSTIRVTTLLVAPARRERALTRQWAGALRRAGLDGPVVSWSPHPEKGLDPEGLYLAWRLDQPWLGNLATDGHDLAEAIALGARVIVAKTQPGQRSPPAWIQGAWSVIATTDAERVTFRDGRYFVLVPP